MMRRPGVEYQDDDVAPVRRAWGSHQVLQGVTEVVKSAAKPPNCIIKDVTFRIWPAGRLPKGAVEACFVPIRVVRGFSFHAAISRFLKLP